VPPPPPPTIIDFPPLVADVIPPKNLPTISTSRPPVGETGPEVLAIMAGGAAAGYAWMRRRWRK
jgi:hypothetical protein